MRSALLEEGPERSERLLSRNFKYDNILEKMEKMLSSAFVIYKIESLVAEADLAKDKIFCLH